MRDGQSSRHVASQDDGQTVFDITRQLVAIRQFVQRFSRSVTNHLRVSSHSALYLIRNEYSEYPELGPPDERREALEHLHNYRPAHPLTGSRENIG